MKRYTFIRRLAATIALPAAILMFSTDAAAHCDGLDGPVVGSARQALESGNVNHVLIWVNPHEAGQIKASFDKTLKARKAGGAAQEAADRRFFETLVRLHRAGEGEPYTGLKPAGRDLGPAIPAADAALASGSVDALADLLADATRASVKKRFQEAMETRTFDKDDVAAGRRYVAAYVGYLHAVERMHEAALTPAHGEAHAAHAEKH